jgi:hexosaminidase
MSRHPCRFSALSPTTLFLSLFLLLLSNPAHALWPQPRFFHHDETALRLAPSFIITVAIHNAPEDLHAAVQRTHSYLRSDRLTRLTPTHGAEDAPVIAVAPELPRLLLRLEGDHTRARSVAAEARVPLARRDEAYNLSVPADGSGAVLSARTTLGLFRGLNTFTQLWYYHAGDGDDAGACAGAVAYTLSAPVTIQDSPAYVRLQSDCLSLFSPFPFLLLVEYVDTKLTEEGDSHIAGSCWTRREICMSSFVLRVWVVTNLV